HDAATGKVTRVGAAEDGLPVDASPVVAVTADGTRAVAYRYPAYAVIELKTGKTLQTIKSDRRDPESEVSLSADGKLFAYGTRIRRGEVRQEVVVVDVEKNILVARVTVLQNESVS